MRKTMLLLTVLGFVAWIGAADNPFIGTWKLNVAKSKASDPSSMAKWETIKTEALDNGFKNTCDGVDANGKAYHYTWSPRYDGKDYPITGLPDADTSSMKKVDSNTVVEVWKKAGKEVAHWRVTVAKDGKTHTVSGKIKDEKGQDVTFDWVYDKQ